MEIRPLLSEEIPQAEAIDGVVFPEGTMVIAALEDGKIVGRIALMSVTHVEGTWVDEKHRGGTLAARLVKAAEQTLLALGFTSVIAWTPDEQPEVASYLARFGYTRLPVSTWQKTVGAAATAQGD